MSKGDLQKRVRVGANFFQGPEMTNSPRSLHRPSWIRKRTVQLARIALRPFGASIVPVAKARPAVWGAVRISGSFPTGSELNLIGRKENYFIHADYQHRDGAVYFDDTPMSDEWQLEVYQFAREVCEKEAFLRVTDIGCGSAFKLVKFFGDKQTVGIDVKQTCEWLRRKYPSRTWMEFDALGGQTASRSDLVIAADVIEHMEKPDDLLAAIESMSPRLVVISTPDRNLLRLGTHNGPPANPAHVREWGFAEFAAYIGERFDIIEHFISCAPQGTQCVLCRPKLLK